MPDDAPVMSTVFAILPVIRVSVLVVGREHDLAPAFVLQQAEFYGGVRAVGEDFSEAGAAAGASPDGRSAGDVVPAHDGGLVDNRPHLAILAASRAMDRLAGHVEYSSSSHGDKNFRLNVIGSLRL